MHPLRERFDHPVIDVDGHILEFEPFYDSYLREAGKEAHAAFSAQTKAFGTWYAASAERRAAERIRRPAFGLPTKNTLDLATVLMPKLLYSRLDSIGIDYSIIYPTTTLVFLGYPDRDLRRAILRAVNRCHADLMREFADRMTIAALIPMQDPADAIEDLEYAVNTLGFKVVVIEAMVRRPVPAIAKAYPDMPPALARHAVWIDNYALESEHDYDPFWKRCVELGVNVTSHTPAFWGGRASTTSYLNNHLGQFADSGEALLKAVLLGGVTHRFPSIKFGFLEGGVGWACRLYSDIIEHFEKRNPEAMENYHPDHIDTGLLQRLCDEHGSAGLWKPTLEETCPLLWVLAGWCLRDRAQLDEWQRSGITSKADLRDKFTSNFYFGCEGDDRTVAWAFDTKRNPLGAKLHPMFGSDIGHWDVVDIQNVLEEPYKLIEKGILEPPQFRDFVFANAARFHASTNPAFFRGTVVERAVANELAREHP
jgi:predicted TIM-barrel fold metal-dependent hydrolase